MSTGFLEERRNALEESFFKQLDEKLRERMKQKRAAAATKSALAAVSSITNDAVLDHLVALNISASTLAALSLIPLVEVAWSDDRMDEDERKAILGAAAASGVTRGSESCAMLESWLAKQPDPGLLKAWKEYVRAVSHTMDARARTAWKMELLAHTHHVAQSAGGVLGFGNRLSKGEKIVLKELEAAFE